jgi:acyl carrier protein
MVNAQQELSEWLRERIAFYLDQPPESIDPNAPLTDYGLNSVYAVSVLADVEDHLDVKISDLSLVWDHSTIHGIVRHLASLRAGAEDAR